MNMKICFCVLLCVVASLASPVVKLGPEEEAALKVLVKREAEPLYHRAIGRVPCRRFSAYRCVDQDVPALCRNFEPVVCLDTEFLNVDV